MDIILSTIYLALVTLFLDLQDRPLQSLRPEMHNPRNRKCWRTTSPLPICRLNITLPPPRLEFVWVVRVMKSMKFNAIEKELPCLSMEAGVRESQRRKIP